jgi:uncharacterized membrane protein
MTATFFWYMLAVSVVWPVVVFVGLRIVNAWQDRRDARRWATARARYTA